MTPDDPFADPSFVAGLRPVPTGPSPGPTWPAADLAGVRPDGTPVEVRLEAAGRSLLLAFLATRCDGCRAFWSGAGGPDGGEAADVLAEATVVVVTHGPGKVDVDEVARLAAGVPGVEVVLSERAWVDYRVSAYPFFVLVDPAARRVVGEAVGFGWADVRDLLRSGGPSGRP